MAGRASTRFAAAVPSRTVPSCSSHAVLRFSLYVPIQVRISHLATHSHLACGREVLRAIFSR